MQWYRRDSNTATAGTLRRLTPATDERRDLPRGVARAEAVIKAAAKVLVVTDGPAAGAFEIK